MRRLAFLATLFFVFNLSSSQAQTADADTDLRAVKPDSDMGTAKNISRSTNEKRTVFSLSKIDDNIVKEFKKAWKTSGNGTSNKEGMVLIFANPNGSYKALAGAYTNQERKFSFKWNSKSIAIVHTHPNDSDPYPSRQDLVIADRFGVPIFTLTSKGMFMYDPNTKKISKIKDRLEWSKLSGWARTEQLATNK